MKTILAVFLAIGAICGAQDDPFAVKGAWNGKPPTVYKNFIVSKVGKPRAKETRDELFRLFGLMSVIKADVAGISESLSILQALGPSKDRFLYIASGSQGKIAVLLKDKNLLEKQSVNVVLESDGVYDGSTVLGGATRLPRYREVEDVPNADAPSKEDFLVHLKEGRTYEVKERAQKACPDCFGSGKLGALQGHRICQTCGGSGDAVVVWTLKWQD